MAGLWAVPSEGGEVWFSDSHTQALPTWGRAPSRSHMWELGSGDGVRRRAGGGTPFHGLCQHFRALPRAELVMQFKGKHSQRLSLGEIPRNSLPPPSTRSQDSLRTHWQCYEGNEPITSSFVFQLLKLHAVIGSLDVCQGTSCQKLLPRKSFLPAKEWNSYLQNNILLWILKYLRIMQKSFQEK